VPAARLALAQALWRANRGRPCARREQVKAAQGALQVAGLTDDAAEMRRWLAAHRLRS